MKTKLASTIMVLLAAVSTNGQISTINRNIKKEVTNVDGTDLKNDIKGTTQHRTILQKMVNKSKKGQVNADWDKNNDKDQYNGFIKIPAVAFPGFVKVTLTQNDKDLGPQMTVASALDRGGAIISGGVGNTENRNVRTAHFSVEPGMSYNVMVSPFNNAKSYSPPIQYVLKWEYTGLEDIYEPNNTKKQAKYVDFDKKITAYAVSGYIKNHVSGIGENTYDWYSIVLKEKKKIKMDILEKPSDIDFVIRLFDANGNSQYLTKTPNAIASTYELDKGTYFIEMHARLKRDASRTAQYQSEPVPDHFKKPYRFEIQQL